VLPIEIRPDQLADEMLQYSRSSAKASRTCSTPARIDTGVSPKTVVYREDKVILYRYDAPDGVKQRNGCRC